MQLLHLMHNMFYCQFRTAAQSDLKDAKSTVYLVLCVATN